MIVEAINWLLTNGADLLLWLWGLMKAVVAGLGTGLNAALNPVLSPVLAAINPVCVWLGDGVYALFGSSPPWLSLTVLSVLAGLIMLIAFRYTSNRTAIGKAKDQIKANLLALKLYNNELRVTFQTQWRLLLAVLRLQRYMITPVAVMLAPMMLGLAQMGLRHQWRPLHSGDQTLIRMRIDERVPLLGDAEIQANAGAVVEAGPVPGGGELVWRVRAGQPGRHTLKFILNGSSAEGTHTIEKEVVVGTGFQRVSAMRVAGDWVEQLMHPVEPRLPPALGVRSIEIAYPAMSSRIYGSNWWLAYFFVISMLTAILLRPLFKVKF